MGIEDLSKDTTWASVFKHELFHVFGIVHTHRRKDRDNYVQINWNNIIGGKNNVQYKMCEDCKVPKKVPYECNSIMHYGPNTFKKKGKGPTMTGRKRGGNPKHNCYAKFKPS